MTEVSGNRSDLSAIPKEELDKLDWDAISQELADFVTELRGLMKPAYFVVGKETLAKAFCGYREQILRDFLVPVQGFLAKRGILSIVLKYPKCLIPRK